MRSLIMARVESDLPADTSVPQSIARDCFVTALEAAMFEFCTVKSPQPNESWGSLYFIRKDRPFVALVSFGAEEMQDMWWEEHYADESSADSDEAVAGHEELHLSISYFEDLVELHYREELTASWPEDPQAIPWVHATPVTNLI
ncbi:E4 ORFC [Murine adenovirus 3]|uniref:E4 ORFC n=1 Tax=Murine adenovirus 3 TaxID=573199 RepID=C3SAV8_9ADEN|nr:E4 ORFC [Murine adenovirus 3]ACJ14528.1 E4 ORFC [Murine adenovirus 3]